VLTEKGTPVRRAEALVPPLNRVRQRLHDTPVAQHPQLTRTLVTLGQGTLEYRVHFSYGGAPISPWHDIPLAATPAGLDGALHFCCEIPKWTRCAAALGGGGCRAELRAGGPGVGEGYPLTRLLLQAQV